jgi:hypothetical protein
MSLLPKLIAWVLTVYPLNHNRRGVEMTIYMNTDSGFLSVPHLLGQCLCSYATLRLTD